jgi:hypothetical protein
MNSTGRPLAPRIRPPTANVSGGTGRSVGRPPPPVCSCRRAEQRERIYNGIRRPGPRYVRMPRSTKRAVIGEATAEIRTSYAWPGCRTDANRPAGTHRRGGRHATLEDVGDRQAQRGDNRQQQKRESMTAQREEHVLAGARDDERRRKEYEDCRQINAREARCHTRGLPA